MYDDPLKADGVVAFADLTADLIDKDRGVRSEYCWMLASERPDDPGQTYYCFLDHFLALWPERPGIDPGEIVESPVWGDNLVKVKLVRMQ